MSLPRKITKLKLLKAAFRNGDTKPVRACYSSNLLATGSISSLIVEFAWRSAPPPHTSSLLKIKLRWAASSIFYLFSKGYIYMQG